MKGGDMKVNFIAFLIVASITGICLAQGIGTGSPENGSSSSNSSSPMGNGTIENSSVNNINSENAQDNSETGAQGNTENSAY
jgi:hypothetical protein